LLIFLTNANHAVPGMGGIAGGVVFGTGCEPGHQLLSSQPQNAQKFSGPKEILAHKAVLWFEKLQILTLEMQNKRTRAHAASGHQDQQT